MLKIDGQNNLRIIQIGDCFKSGNKIYTLENVVFKIFYPVDENNPKTILSELKPLEITLFIKVFDTTTNKVEYIESNTIDFFEIFNETNSLLGGYDNPDDFRIRDF